ncbi:MAG TPA: hypothetical protein VMY78_13375 [Solirubrobacteraceae bacterium]|nr:hypothetical protein [Solirubrobacteraceae bacterium]
MSRPPYRPARADRLLQALREQRIPYTCHEQIARWDSRCPLCAGLLVIREHGHRGRVSVRCDSNCDEAAVKFRIWRPEACHECGSVHGQADELARVAGELLHLARAQQTLLREQLAPQQPDALAA